MNFKLIYQTESEFNTIKVFQDENGKFYLRLNEGTEIHSMYDPENIILKPEAEHYWNFLTLFPVLHGNAKKILFLGAGGGTALSQIAHYFPEIEIHGVEMDQEIINIAQKYFNMTSPNIKIHIADGLHFIKETEEKFDIIFLDAFIGGNLSPRFLRVNIFDDLKKILNPNGIIVGNYLATRTVHYLITRAMKLSCKKVYKMSIPDCYNTIMWGSGEDYPQITNKPPEDLVNLTNFFNQHTKRV